MASYPLGLEDIEPGHFVAWVLPLPGCYARGDTATAALAGGAAAVRRWQGRLHAHGLWPAGVDEPVGTVLLETWTAQAAPNDPNYLINAFFAADRPPLTAAERPLIEGIMALHRAALRQAAGDLTPDELVRPLRGGETIGRLLSHIARAENWYFSHFDRGLDREALRALDPWSQLEAVRRHALEQLPALIGSREIVTVQGERWSGRKLVRRLLWHEDDHTRQIERLLAGSG